MTHVYSSTSVRNLEIPSENYSIKNFLEKDFPKNTISKKVIYKLGENREITVKVQTFSQCSEVSVKILSVMTCCIGKKFMLVAEKKRIKENLNSNWNAMTVKSKNCTSSQDTELYTFMANFNQNNGITKNLSTSMDKKDVVSVKDSKGNKIPLSQISNLV